MNRRDAIVVAVLINAGVLIVLFASALKSKTTGEQMAAVNSSSQMVHEIPLIAESKEKIETPRDEVDQVLSQLAMTNSQMKPAETHLENKSIATETAPVDFTADLNAFASSENKAEENTASQAVQEAPKMVTPAQEVRKPFTEIRVKKGDFLAKIARRHHCSVEELMKINHLKSSNLKIGQTLKIPNPAKNTSSSQQKSIPSDENAVYYTVRPGDNPWTIALKNKIKVEELLQLNNLDAEKAKRLKPGDRLRVK